MPEPSEQYSCKCGSDEFRYKLRITGTCDWFVDANGKATDNSNMYDSVTYKRVSRVTYCANCGKKATVLVSKESK